MYSSLAVAEPAMEAGLITPEAVEAVSAATGGSGGSGIVIIRGKY